MELRSRRIYRHYPDLDCYYSPGKDDPYHQVKTETGVRSEREPPGPQSLVPGGSRLARRTNVNLQNAFSRVNLVDHVLGEHDDNLTPDTLR